MALIGFITAADLSRFFPSQEEPLLTHDDRVAAQCLRTHGHTVEPIVWGRQVPSRVDVAIVRSPWDYQDSSESAARFFEWLEEVASRVLVINPVALMRWNLDKRYLRDLETYDAPIVPTEYYGADRPLRRADLAALAERHPIVLKPSISAAAHDTFLIQDPGAVDRLESHNGSIPVDIEFDAWRGDRTFLVQPFLPEIRDRGEWSVVFIDGEATHAVLKRPRVGDWRVQDELGGSVETGQPPEAVLRAAQDSWVALRRAHPQGADALYARIDIVETESGALTSELELFEPELFFKRRGVHSGAVEDRAVAAFRRGVERRLDASPRPE